MLFHASPNRKISASLFEEMFEIEVANTDTLSNYQEVVAALEKLHIETANKAIEVILGELEQKQQEVFEMYSLAHTNYSFTKYQNTLYYKNIQAIRVQIKEVALWMYDGDCNAMPIQLRKQFFL